MLVDEGSAWTPNSIRAQGSSFKIWLKASRNEVVPCPSALACGGCVVAAPGAAELPGGRERGRLRRGRREGVVALFFSVFELF